jgi:hypothetical protein
VLNFNQYSNHNFDGDRLGAGGNVNMHWAFQNLWSTGFGVNLNARGFDDRLTRGGPGGYRNGNIGWWQYFNTNDRRPVSFHWFSFVNNDWNGSRAFELVPRIAVRPASALSAELGFRWNNNKDDAQWIEKVEREGEIDRHLFGRLHQTTVAITTRLNYTITPNLSLQLYGEPFVSSGDYEHYKELVAGRAARHADRYAPFAHADDEDFSVLSFRTTNVLRWEFKPGSTLFVVWQQSREGDGDDGRFRFGRDFRDVFSTGATNTLLVKFAYWVNP